MSGRAKARGICAFVPFGNGRHTDEKRSVSVTSVQLLEARFARGGRAAFLEAYEALSLDVRNWVKRFFKSPFEQEEAVQEVWLTIHRMQGGFDPARGELRAWLRSVCANRCREILRASSRRPAANVPIEDVADAVWLDAPLADEAVHQQNLKTEIERFSKTLGAEEAAALQLCFVEQRTHSEIAAKLNIDERRSKYLKQKVLKAAMQDERLMAVLEEAKIQ